MISAIRIPIIIVSYRNPTDVVGCLKALQKSAEDPAFDVYICENGGAAAFDELLSALVNADGLCEHGPMREPMPQFVRVQSLRLCGREAEVAIAEAEENLGYGSAINAWLRVLLAVADWPGVWVLNPDTQPEPRALAELVAWAAQRKKGMVGSRIVALGQSQIVGTRGLRWRRLRAITAAIDKGAPSTVKPDPEEIEARLDAPSGTSIYITRQCLDRIGLMDERYFLFLEDLEWGYRAKRSCGVGYAHSSVVEHRHGTTTGSDKADTPFTVYLEFRNRLNFVRQHHPAWVAWTILMLVLRSFEHGIGGGFISLLAALSGLRAGIAGETGRPDRVFDFDGGMPRLRNRPLSVLRSLDGERGAGDGAAKRNAKVAISLIYYVATGLVRGLRRIAGRPAPHRLVILYYHAVPSALRARFARQLEMLLARATVVPADYHGPAVRGGHSVAITFDDALTSALDNAIPELRARNMPSTIFVPAGALGASPDWEVEKGRDYEAESVAGADTLRSLVSDLVQLGAHSLTHPHLPQLPPDDARREIAGCREQMREIFGIDAHLFTFPYGDHDAATIQFCREAGYDRVFTVIPQSVDPASDQFARGRVLVDPADRPLEFYLKMSGAYAWMAYVSALKQWSRTRLVR
jgi:N-acetylglucosaminyl-diphospho-decaprenol L-rhamnosyltransferase